MSNERLAQRLSDLISARNRFREAIAEWQLDHRPIIRDSVIKRFEFTFELAWKATGDWLRVWERDLDAGGPRQTLENGFARGLMPDANRWSMMLLYRNRTVHVYNESDVEAIAEWVVANAVELFNGLIVRLSHDG